MKMRLLLPLFFVCSLCYTSLKSQIAWEMRWSVEGITYNGLEWTTNTPGYLTMRVRYQTRAGWSEIEQALQYTTDGLFGYWIGSSPFFIRFASYDQVYNADSFVWYQNLIYTYDGRIGSVVPHCRPIYTQVDFNGAFYRGGYTYR